MQQMRKRKGKVKEEGKKAQETKRIKKHSGASLYQA